MDVTRDVPGMMKRENVSKNASEVPLKTRVNDADVVTLNWKKKTAEPCRFRWCTSDASER